MLGAGCLLLRQGATAIVTSTIFESCQVLQRNDWDQPDGSKSTFPAASCASAENPMSLGESVCASAGAIAVGFVDSFSFPPSAINPGPPVVIEVIGAPSSLEPLSYLDMKDSIVVDAFAENRGAVGNNGEEYHNEATAGIGVFRGIATLDRVQITNARVHVRSTPNGFPLVGTPIADMSSAVHAVLPGTKVVLRDSNITQCKVCDGALCSTFGNYIPMHTLESACTCQMSSNSASTVSRFGQVGAHLGATLQLLGVTVANSVGKGVVADSGSEVTLTSSVIESSSGVAVFVRDDFNPKVKTVWETSQEASDTVRAQIGAYYREDVGPFVTLEDSTRLRSNGGYENDVQISATAGAVVYKLPAPPGHFLFSGVACEIKREPCPSGNSLESFYCQQERDSEQCRYNSSASQPCAPALPSASQVCDYVGMPHLLKAYVSPPLSYVTSDVPLPCSASLQSRADAIADQLGIQCGGLCEAGRYCPEQATLTPAPDCPRGQVCPPGSITPTPCADGTWLNSTGQVQQSDCNACPPGHECSNGAVVPSPCAAGKVAAGPWQRKCASCATGTYQIATGQTACWSCIAGSYCPEGATTPLPCPAGTFSSRTDLGSADECSMTQAGYASGLGSVEPTPCDKGHFAAVGGRAECIRCDDGHFQNRTGQVACEICPAGFWCTAEEKVPCTKDTYNPDAGQMSQLSCRSCGPLGTTNELDGRSAATDCLCQADYYDPAPSMMRSNASSCEQCPSGSECAVAGATIDAARESCQSEFAENAVATSPSMAVFEKRSRPPAM